MAPLSVISLWLIKNQPLSWLEILKLHLKRIHNAKVLMNQSNKFMETVNLTPMIFLMQISLQIYAVQLDIK